MHRNKINRERGTDYYFSATKKASKPTKMAQVDERDKQALQHIEDVTIHASQIQRQILTQILSTNADVEYLQQHGLHGSIELSTFKNLIPLISYEQLRPYIDRIANGDDSPILCTNPITEFFIRYTSYSLDAFQFHA